MARVSIIVPTFNRVGYLGETIASILQQDYRDFDLVVADNASTDGTAGLISAVDDPRLHHVRRKRNIGWRANFNQALASADSEYVAVVADDDRLLPGALMRAVRCLDEASSVGLVHTSFHVIDERGEVIRTDRSWNGDVAEDLVERGSDFIADAMHTGVPVCLSSVVMRTDALPEVCFEPADEDSGDFVLFLRIALDRDVAFLATAGVELRVHDGQLSNAFDTVEKLRVLEHCKLRFLSANSARLDDTAALRRAARGYTSARLSLTVSMAASDSRAEGIAALRRAVRFRPHLLLAPRTWRAAGKIVVGHRTLRYLRGRRPLGGAHQ
jgi:glycosyltransferase involved in cell wall biosynthesis